MWAALWLFTAVSPAGGARITGEDGVTSAAPSDRVSAGEDREAGAQEVQEPVPAKPASRPPAATPGEQQTQPTQVLPSAGVAVSPARGTQTATIAESASKPDNTAAADDQPDEPYVTIDFDDVDLPVFIKFISELTGKNFVIDNAVKGKVSIVSPTKISADEAYRVFESVLEVHGFAAVPAGSIIKIVPAVSAKSMSVETRLRMEAVSSEDKVITQLIPLRYADPEELKKLFTPLISKNSVVVSYPPTRTLIVTDVLSNIERLLRITKAIDVEGVGEEISVIPLRHAVAATLSKSLDAVFQKRAGRSKATQQVEAEVRIRPGRADQLSHTGWHPKTIRSRSNSW